MSSLDQLRIYVFDIFEKSQTKEIISKLEAQFGPVDTGPHTISFMGMTNKTIHETRYFLEVKDHNLVINKAVETSEKGLVGNVDFARKGIEKITFLGIDSEELPFFVLMMIVSVNNSLFILKKLEEQVNSILRPLRLVMEEFNGITRQIRGEKPICPYFLDIDVVATSKEIFEITTDVEISQGEYESIDGEQVPPEGVQALRNLVPIWGFERDFNLLSVPKIFEDTVLFVGNVAQIGMNGLMTSFLLKFSSKKYDLGSTKLENMISILPRSNDDLLLPWNAAGTMVFLISMFSWATYLEKSAPDLEKKFTEWRKTIHDKLESYNESELEESVLKLEKNGTDIATSIAEIGRLRRIMESAKGEFLKGGTRDLPEISIPPSNKAVFYHIWKSTSEKLGSGTYLNGMKRIIIKILNKVEENLNQYQRENELFSRNVNNIISLHHQKKTKEYSRAMIGVTAAVFVFTAIIVGINASEFSTANFDPIITTNNPDIILGDRYSLNQFEYRIPLEISTMTSHHYKITVWAIKDSVKLTGYGTCYIKDISIVTSENSIVYLTSDGDEIILEPRFRFNFEDTLPYFSPEQMERSGLHAIGHMQFGVLSQDIQDEKFSDTITVRAHLSMLIPTTFKPSEHCEKLGLN